MASQRDRYGDRPRSGAAPTPLEQDSRDSQRTRQDAEGDAALSGWDPYIVAITGGAEPATMAAGAPGGIPADTLELGLLARLRASGA